MRRVPGFALLIAVTAVAAVGARPSVGSSPVPVEVPGEQLPVLRQHTYRMAGKIRVLLLWVGRDDVGSAVIRWRGAEDRKAFEVLIGTDPQKAPGQLNKWGFLAEEVHNGESAVVGFISQENDEKLSEVKAGLKKRAELRAFDTVRGLVPMVEARARVGTLHAPSELTYHDAPAVLENFLADTSLPLKTVARRGDVRAGFLSALTELVTASLQKTSIRRIPYVHGDKLYELKLVESSNLTRFERDGRTYEHVIRSRFETGEASSRAGTRFELVYGASGALAGIPILISYQPKWWLQVDLVLNS